MPTFRRTGLLGFAALWGCGLLSGCCQFATVRCWQPASADVSGLQKLAVVDFSGDHGPEVAAAVNAQLHGRQCYELVDQRELTGIQHAACSACPTETALVAQAREQGVDAVILGEVVSYRCNDELPGIDEPKQQERRPFRGEADLQDELRRDAEVSIAFKLVDARTGTVRAVQTATHTFHGARTDESQLPARGEVLRELTEQCVRDFVEQLAPHQTDCAMKLARGGWYGRAAGDVRTGNRLAMQGDWDGARDHWHAAIEHCSDCDAALYNLAIDAAHRQQYERAEELAMQAIRLRHTDNYAQGLERIRQYRSGYDAAEQQRDGRILQASATF
jgi:hypothetical protein